MAAPSRPRLHRAVARFLLQDMPLSCTETTGSVYEAGSTAYTRCLDEEGTADRPFNFLDDLIDEDEDERYRANETWFGTLSALDDAFSKLSCPMPRALDNVIDTHLPQDAQPRSWYLADLNLSLHPGVAARLRSKTCNAVILPWRWIFPRNRHGRRGAHAAMIVIDKVKKRVIWWDPQAKVIPARGSNIYKKLRDVWEGRPDAFYLPGYRYAPMPADAVNMQEILTHRNRADPARGHMADFSQDGICMISTMIITHLCLKFNVMDPYVMEKAFLRALGVTDTPRPRGHLAERVITAYMVLAFDSSADVRPYNLIGRRGRSVWNAARRTTAGEARKACMADKKSGGGKCGRTTCIDEVFCWQHRAGAYRLSAANKKCANAIW